MLLGVLATLTTGTAHADVWYLNGSGPGTPPQLWAFGDDGLPLSADPVVAVSAKLRAIAWPSAVRVGSAIRLYASAYSGGWNTVRLWRSEDGVTFADLGAVFAADVSEPHGVGPTHVMYEPGAPEPYTMYYVVRGPSGPGGVIAVATSRDGTSWTRKGTVLSASLPEEASGLSVSYACRRDDGDRVLVYHGYSLNATKGVAIVATARGGVTRPFAGKSVVKRFDDFDTTLTGGAGQRDATVPPHVTVPLGIPLLIGDATAREAIVATRQKGRSLGFDRPLSRGYSGAPLYSMARNKTDLSHVRELPDGAWRGIFTLYKPAALVAEYTTEGLASSLTGPWRYAGKGFRFRPSLPGTLHSLENPTPLVGDASCRN